MGAHGRYYFPKWVKTPFGGWYNYKPKGGAAWFGVTMFLWASTCYVWASWATKQEVLKNRTSTQLKG
jgi:hypothetical protein